MSYTTDYLQGRGACIISSLVTKNLVKKYEIHSHTTPQLTTFALNKKLEVELSVVECTSIAERKKLIVMINYTALLI